MKRAMLADPAKLWRVNTDLRAVNRHGTKMSPCNHIVPLVESQHYIIDPTNPRGALDDGVEDRLHVRRRAADNAEHLRRCGLMLQSLSQLRITLLQFFEQPHVLNGDDRLVGEGFKQCDLLIRKGRTSVRRMTMTPIGWSSRIRGAARTVRMPALGDGEAIGNLARRRRAYLQRGSPRGRRSRDQPPSCDRWMS